MSIFAGQNWQFDQLLAIFAEQCRPKSSNLASKNGQFAVEKGAICRRKTTNLPQNRSNCRKKKPERKNAETYIIFRVQQMAANAQRLCVLQIASALLQNGVNLGVVFGVTVVRRRRQHVLRVGGLDAMASLRSENGLLEFELELAADARFRRLQRLGRRARQQRLAARKHFPSIYRRARTRQNARRTKIKH